MIGRPVVKMRDAALLVALGLGLVLAVGACGRRGNPKPPSAVEQPAPAPAEETQTEG
ncbi:MAG: hypothetical protein AAF074_07380 [Pseudomonadota bacterium]